MKIALITNSFLPRVGGAEYVVHHLARTWGHAGHEVTVFTVKSGEAPAPDLPYTVRPFSLLRGSTRFGYHRFPFLPFAIKTVGALLETFHPDFISAHFGYPTALWLAGLSPVPRFVITCHGAEINPKEKPRAVYHLDEVLAEALNSAQAVVAISSYGRRLMQEMGVLAERIHLIPNGIDRERFRRPVEFDLRGRFDIPKDAPVVLSVGRENWIKAFDTGIEAFAKVLDRVPQAYYVLLGRGNERWLPLVRQLGIERNVVISRLYGDELVGAYQQADVYFSSSVYEGCPVVVLEAMAAGLPAVVTNVSGSQDMIQTGENGIVVEPRCPGDMAEAICSLLHDKSLQKRYSLANIERSHYYDWSNIGRMYLELA
jgi:phosphatidylinositol alpha-mannosyltransferase